MLNTTLEQGVLSFDRASLTAAGSGISGYARLDTSAACESVTAKLVVRDFDLATLSPWMEEGPIPGGVLDELTISMDSCGQSIEAQLHSLSVQARLEGLDPLIDNAALPLSLLRLEAGLGWTDPVSISFEGELLHEPLSLSATFGSVSSILENRSSVFRLSARNDGFTMTADGAAELGVIGLDLDLGLTLDVARMGSLDAWLGTEPDSRLPFRGSTRIRLDQRGLIIEDLDTTLGRSDISGSLDWPDPESGLPLIVALSASHVDLNELADLFPESTGQKTDEATDWAELLEDSEWAGQWFDLPYIELDIEVASLRGLLEDSGGVRLSARLQDKSIRDGQLAFRMEGIDIAGAMEADFSTHPWVVHFESTLNNIDIGRLLASLELRDDVTARAERVDIRMDSQGRNLRELVMNGRMDSRLESLEWTFEGGPKQRAFEVRLSELEVTTRPSTDTIWQTHGELNGSPIRAWLKTPLIHETFDSSLALPIRLVLGSPNGTIMVDTVIDPVSNEGAGANLVVSGMFRGSEGIDLADLESPLGDYAFEVRALVRENEFLKTEFQGRVASSRAAGKFDTFVLGDGLRFELDLDSPFLETDDLVNWAEDFRNAHGVITDGIPAENARENVNIGILKLLDEYIREYSGRNEVQITANVDELHSSGKLFGQMELELNLVGNDLRIEPLTIALPGGKVDVSYHGGGLGAEGIYELDVDVERLEYGGLLRLLDPESKAEGEMFLDIDLVSYAPQADQVVHNLAGHVDMAVFPVDARAGLLDLWASNLVFALLSTGDDPDKQLNCLVARFDVEDGVMHAKNAFLDSTEVIVRARGDIDLGQRQLDLLVAPQSKREKFLSVSTPIAVTGSFDDFQIGVAPGGFLATMIRWYYGLIYVPWKWLTGERFPADGIATCRQAMGWEPAAD